jgi:diguanylate cyclase
VDQSFVSGVGQNDTDTALVEAAIKMAHALRLQAVAEGVETESQRNCLHAMGCDLLQGYFFSHPLTVEQVQSALSKPTSIGKPRAA